MQLIKKIGYGFSMTDMLYAETLEKYIVWNKIKKVIFLKHITFENIKTV